jgi:hypothetical protein
VGSWIAFLLFLRKTFLLFLRKKREIDSWTNKPPDATCSAFAI